MKKNFFITTPIYYGNGVPHVGHAYSSLVADTIARYKKISGYNVKFSTGIDENSQKVVEKAEENKVTISDYLDNMAVKHKKIWNDLNIEYTDFIRTTEERHHEFVKTVLQKSFDKGDIYEGEYEGMYCVGCEAFKKEEDLVFLNKTSQKTFPISDKVKVSDNIIQVCPDHLTTPDKIKEKNYFFKLSKYQDFILNHYKENPNFVSPNDRFNEVKAFVKRGLEDFSISRETNKFGITLPFDESQVTYVWYDALFNYLTVCQGKNEKFWPANLHIVGKDIIRFHAIYWPAMLKSAGYEMPKQILTTGFLTVEGQKISKSLGNAINTSDFLEVYPKDLLNLYLLSSFNIGQDGDFDTKQAILIFNAKLANNLGNLLNRVIVLTIKLNLESGLKGKLETNIDNNIKSYVNNFTNSINQYNLKESLDLSFKFLDTLNKFVDNEKPWNLIKDDINKENLINIFYTISEGLRQTGLNLYPFFPEKMGNMFNKLGLEKYTEQLKLGKLEYLRYKKEIFYIKEKGEALFSRVENIK